MNPVRNAIDALIDQLTRMGDIPMFIRLGWEEWLIWREAEKVEQELKRAGPLALNLQPGMVYCGHYKGLAIIASRRWAGGIVMGAQR